jgi:hypothetical protein
VPGQGATNASAAHWGHGTNGGAEPGASVVRWKEAQRVPWRGRQRGTGSRLIQGALEQARAQHVRVVARCSFVADDLAKHPEFAELGT